MISSNSFKSAGFLNSDLRNFETSMAEYSYRVSAHGLVNYRFLENGSMLGPEEIPADQTKELVPFFIRLRTTLGSRSRHMGKVKTIKGEWETPR
jgi:hypothetical protein